MKKTLITILAILGALAAAAALLYVFRDKLRALLDGVKCKCCCDCDCEEDDFCDCDVDDFCDSAEAVPAEEEAPVEKVTEAEVFPQKAAEEA